MTRWVERLGVKVGGGKTVGCVEKVVGCVVEVVRWVEGWLAGQKGEIMPTMKKFYGVVWGGVTTP